MVVPGKQTLKNQGLMDEDLTRKIIGAMIEVHRCLGRGLLESVYRDCLAHELTLQGLAFEKEIPIPVSYKGVLMGCAFRADMVVEKKVLLELKAVDLLSWVHEAQVINYLKLSGLKIGLLVNFNSERLVDGLRRYAN